MNEKSSEKAANLELKIKYMPIEELVPYSGNCKIHTSWQIGQISLSIESRGFLDPIAIDERTKEIVEGHGRLEAAKQLGLKEVPVISLSHLSALEIRAYRLAHNKITTNTGYDSEREARELKYLLKEDEDILMSTGYLQAEIDKLLATEIPITTQRDEKIEVPERDRAVKVILYFDSAVWLTKRQEVLDVLAKMEKTYRCRQKIDE